MTLAQCWHKVPGGTAVAALEFSRRLDALGDVEVVGIAARRSQPAPEPYVPEVEMRHHKLPRPLLYETWQRLKWPSPDALVPDADLLHATTVIVPPTIKPLVVTIHDLAFLHYPELFTARGIRVMTRGFEQARDLAELVFCSSQATLDDCEQRGIDPAKLRLIPLGVSSERASAAEVAAVLKQYELSGSYLLWNGTVEPRKNLPRLLEAFGLLDETLDLDLVLVGPEGWNESLVEPLSALGEKATRVKRLGFVPGRDLAALHASAEVFCFPSLFEGFGFPVLEAMAQGTPVVTSRGTSTEELLGDAGLLVDPLDAGDIAGAITRLLEDSDLNRQATAATSSQVERYSWAGCVEKIHAGYEGLFR